MTDMQITEAQVNTWATAVLAEIDNDAAKGVFDDRTPASWEALAEWVDSFDYLTAVGVPWGSDLGAGSDDGRAVTDRVAKAVDAILKARVNAELEADNEARAAELNALYEATQAHDNFMEAYSENELDNDRNPTADGYVEWLERQLWNARYGLD